MIPSKCFNQGLEVRGIFLDISKDSDNIWHDGLIFKLRQNGVTGDVIQTPDSSFEWSVFILG